jgi:hypothetical protein
MRILSKTNDYYDSARGLLYDDHIIYHRNTIDITSEYAWGNQGIFMQPSYRFNNTGVNTFTAGVVVFCGKQYPFLNVDAVKSKTYPYYTIEKQYITYDIKHIKEILTEDATGQYVMKRNMDWLDTVSKPNNKLLSVLTERKVPYFVAHSCNKFNKNTNKIILNPILSDFKFYKVIDAYSAFQEISMYIGNDLVNDTIIDVPVGDDVTLAESKGFNKHSFRADKKKDKRGNNK